MGGHEGFGFFLFPCEVAGLFLFFSMCSFLHSLTWFGRGCLWGDPMRYRINVYEPAMGRFVPVVFSVVGVFAVV